MSGYKRLLITTVSPAMSTAQFLSAIVELNIPLTAPLNTTALSAHHHSLKSIKIISVPVNHTLKAMPRLDTVVFNI